MLGKACNVTCTCCTFIVFIVKYFNESSSVSYKIFLGFINFRNVNYHCYQARCVDECFAVCVYELKQENKTRK